MKSCHIHPLISEHALHKYFTWNSQYEHTHTYIHLYINSPILDTFITTHTLTAKYLPSPSINTLPIHSVPLYYHKSYKCLLHNNFIILNLKITTKPPKENSRLTFKNYKT